VEIAMMLALKSWIAAAALGLGAMAFSAPAEARGFGGFRGGISGFHGGGMRGFGRFRNPAVFIHPGSFRSPFFNRRGFVSRQFFFRRRFADDRRFFFRRHRFVGRSQSVLPAPLTTLRPTTLPMQYPRMIKA
jgi:hypothetical protein